MKSLGIFSLLIMVYVSAYTDINNDFNYDDVVANVTQLKSHLDCFLDKAPCSAIAGQYKSHILDTLINDCAYCTSQHKHNAKSFLHGIKEKFPEGYLEMKKKYDPENLLFKIFEDYVENF